MSRFLRAACAATLIACLGSGAQAAAITSLRVAAGAPDAGLYAVAARLQQRVNANAADHRVMLSAQATLGADDDLRRLHEARVDLVVVQDDALAAAHPALAGLAPVAAIATANVVVAARAILGIETLSGLDGRRVDFGAPGEGLRHTTDRLLRAAGARPLQAAPAASATARIAAFCAGEIDAVAILALPGDSALQRLGRCGGRAIDFGAAQNASLRARLPEYSFGALPGPSATMQATTPTVTLLLAGNGSAPRAAAALARAGATVVRPETGRGRSSHGD